MQSEAMGPLVKAVADGDRAAFALLFDFFAPRVVTYYKRAGVSEAVAEDLAQEAMVLLWRKACSFDPARGAVSTWVFAIARNLRTDRHRRERNERLAVDVDDYDPADPAASPDERLDVLQRERLVRMALLRLPSEQLRLLQLSYFAGQPHSDIARDLCLPLGTVKSRIRQALINLRRGLDTLEP
jgi:RNA polymerase sigma factor (sigma-70 family)